MATPHAAGAIGLYHSAMCLQFAQDYKTYPGTLASFMRNYLLTGVDSITSMATTTSSKGRLNLHKGILRSQAFDCAGLPPVAGFTSGTNACLGEPHQFTDNSSGTVDFYNWSFPGGTPSSSTLQNPMITYNAMGTYNVQLIVTNGNGADTILMTSYITVITPPAAPTVIDNTGTLTSSYVGSGNQWYDTNGIIAGATNDTYLPTQGGSYYVVYTDVNGCTSTSAPIISTIGIENYNVNFSIYPNPTTEKLTIDAGTLVKANIKLMDLSGRMVMISKMNQSLMQLDLTQLSDGIYMIRIEYGDRSITKKIIKH
jgi:PKD repeat protein